MILKIVLFLLVSSASGTETNLLTQTVYGFLDFTTTIGNTVMVFSPQSAPPIDIEASKSTMPENIIETRPTTAPKKDSNNNGIKPTPLLVTSSKEQSKTFSSKNEIPNISNTPVKSFVEPPEYALLSRQPEEFAEETYRVVNLKSRADTERQRNYQSKRDSSYPSVSISKKKDVAIVKPSILGTKVYAQTVQSTVLPEKRSKNRQHSSTRVLKTITPSNKANKVVIETARVEPENGSNKNYNKSNRHSNDKRKSSRNKGKRRHKNTQTPSSQISPSVPETSVRRSLRTKVSQQTEENVTNIPPNAFKLNRRPGRWQYKSSPKPKINIRKASSNTTRPVVTTETEQINETVSDIQEKNQIQKTLNSGRDLDAVGSQNSDFPDNEEQKLKNFVQTLNVEISTPSVFDDTYYEIATIKTPFIFQAGLVKKTRFLTVTSTIEKTIKHDHTDEYSVNDGPLTENILESSTQITQPSIDDSITTLRAVHCTDCLETPELETITESFSITQTKLKTQILPIILEKRNETIQITLVQTYDYTSLITVTQTISPIGDHFIPSKNFKDFEGILDEAGSEINLDLEFGDEGNFGKSEKSPFNSTSAKPLEPLTNLSQISKPEIPVINNSVITSTRPVIKLETMWESYIVPLVRGTESILRTLSKSVGVVEKTEYVTDVSTIIPASQFPVSQFPYSLNPFYNPLLPIPPQQLVTSTAIYETMITATSSKVLKLTFGARTAYTTIFSTSVVPSAVTKLITATLPVQNSVSFPNYYPPPYPPFAYVG
ncbi:CG16786 [Drosophila busckii]|uniref:CG16786 n=1 Tax=Drosophila busckii TaxID=30019 RepID=A0A0M3QVM4_DROBS|nr:uncharacterized protein LOC108597749 [Drosophila busckii]XP_017839946.1 uncharacterized protein LOC108597749 [Drosophila busckii]ALC42659.1 CG16786 [Drosophila busckii]